MSGVSHNGSRAEQVVEAVRSYVEPLRGRVDAVEREQAAHETRTQQQINRMEKVAGDALTSVVDHVGRLAVLETIPSRINSLEVKVDGIGTRVGLLESRATAQDARLEGRKEMGAGVRWFLENWMGIAALVFAVVFGYLVMTGQIKIAQSVPQYPYQQDFPSNQRWSLPEQGQPREPTAFQQIGPDIVTPLEEPTTFTAPRLRGRTDAS